MLRRGSCPSGIVAAACQKKQVGKGQEAVARTKMLHLLPNPPKTPVPTHPIPVAHAVSIPSLKTARTDRRCTVVYKSSSLKRRTVTGNMPKCGASLVATAMPSPVSFFDADDRWRKQGVSCTATPKTNCAAQRKWKSSCRRSVLGGVVGSPDHALPWHRVGLWKAFAAWLRSMGRISGQAPWWQAGDDVR